MKNKIEDLRNHLFAAMEKLTEAETPEELSRELERSKGLAEIGKVIVDSAKTEVDFIKAAGGEVLPNTGFFDRPKMLN